MIFPLHTKKGLLTWAFQFGTGVVCSFSRFSRVEGCLLLRVERTHQILVRLTLNIVGAGADHWRGGKISLAGLIMDQCFSFALAHKCHYICYF